MTSSGPSLEGLIAASPSLAAPLRGARRAAATASPILILGESGTGRTSLARAIHDLSARPGRLVEVDVGTIPSTLFESELFGYRAGAFSGADTDYPGRVARAHEGTLVLDHVEELPLEIQPKLLRLLAEGVYAPLGGADREAETRVLAIATEEIQERVSRGFFRDDLYFRLDVLSFTLPPLRRRIEDLEPLVEAMLEDLRARYQRPGLTLAPSALAWMRRYRWPGNLRHLRNVLERQLVMTDADSLDPGSPRDLEGERPRPLKEVERDEILRALAFTRGHQGKAAALLGVSRKALWEKRRRFGIP
ncbi:MAG: sigma 54-interacting transcriptional regulator [Thermoanaerobaculia bacterium]|nr:sigma 54-interacting transcriptional regulator [Thermoanaerobaculia bacterium]